ncbi:hypothetical protein WMW72_05845 [Paenibacillus filicis]|uniref:Gas vesicle protein n=1 Tax=Paenibacillus filicis TaxID=669464 RepID=A0ABU9DF00_9BACL
MKVGTFLLGGIVGAAAAVYVTRKAKPLLFSAFSSSDAASGVWAKNGHAAKSGKPGDSSRSFQSGSASWDGQKSSSGLGNEAGGLGKVEEIIKQDPKLKEAVDEILAGSSVKEQQEQPDATAH